MINFQIHKSFYFSFFTSIYIILKTVANNHNQASFLLQMFNYLNYF